MGDALNSKFVADGLDCVRFRLIRKLDEIEENPENEAKNFAPEFCHQFFGENEAIFGYNKLKIRFLTAFCGCQTFLKISYNDQISDGKPDDICAMVKNIYPEHGISTDFQKFKISLDEQRLFKPFGQQLHVYHCEKDGEKREFQIFKVDHSSKDAKFVEFYEKIEMFAFWYIDAASCVDTTDDRWQFYVTYEKYKNDDGDFCYGFVGYSSVYMYYAYPENLRPRIGHFLVLPPFHGSGHGFQLLQAIYNDMIADNKVLEVPFSSIPAEDPAFSFVKLRDFVDCVNCMQILRLGSRNLDEFRDFKQFHGEICQKLKIGKMQARRIFEILRLKFLNVQNEREFKNYRLEVKRRLYKPYRKTKKDWKTINRSLTVEETTAAAVSMTKENVHSILESLFHQTMQEYEPVLKRLSRIDDLNLPPINVSL